MSASFGVDSLRELSHLRASCAPSCEQTRLDDVKSGMLVADISLGVGIAALGVAALVAIGHMSSAPATSPIRCGSLISRKLSSQARECRCVTLA